MINEKYNSRLRQDDINKVPIAYRTNLHTDTIAEFNKMYQFMIQYSSSYIMIGDFTSFFDRIDEYASGSQYAVRFDVDYNYKDVEHSRVSDLLKFANEEIERRKKAQTFSPITSQLSQKL